MHVKEALILAGGLGTRLREAVPDLPKCMAPVNNRPFIQYVIRYLQEQGIEQFIFSLGYRSEAFTDFLVSILPAHQYTIIVEDEPLGTGGAIQLAGRQAKEENIVVVNGDSIFKINLAAQVRLHFEKKSECTLALKPMVNIDRYGVVEINSNNNIALFKEKNFYQQGLINGGMYLLNLPGLFEKGLPEKFSFETGYLQKYYTDGNMYGIPDNGYFIDIGIPEDYQRAQNELTLV